MPVFASTIFLSAFLLFLVQPIIAKQILPWFGGTPAVWNTCMVFFQALLLAGYAYSDWSTRRLSPRAQAVLHAVLLVASLAALPIVAAAGWKPAGDEDPVWRILALLGATIGLPYFLLSSTGPLVQACFARRYGGDRVYRLFALSNFGSMLALLSFPFLIETVVTTRVQALGWSVAYAAYVLLCIAAVFLGARAVPEGHAQAALTDEPAPSLSDQLLWLCLAALGTTVLLAVTNHITQNVASIPLMWLAPLTLYLLSFILCFEGRGWYRRILFVAPFLAVLPAMAWGLQADDGVLDIYKAVPLFLAGLFIACMFFHGELARSRPAPRHLTRFYLMVSLGGALGGLFVGIVAPRVFNGYYELPLALMAGGLIAAWIFRGMRTVALIAIIATVGSGYYLKKYQEYLLEDTVLSRRDFFGTLRVQDYGTGQDRSRRLVHGVIMHGKQYFEDPRRHEPTTYYGVTSGIGRLVEAKRGPSADRPLRIGVIGLGTGTMAAYGHSGDVIRFYDINPQVIEIARHEFTYLSDSAARVATVLGDARLSMEREAPQAYDVLVIDAFSSDAIPVHLITLQALDVFLKHMAPRGVIAFHVTNRYLNLPPVVKLLADSRGLSAMTIEDEGDPETGASTDWALVSRDAAVFEEAPLAARAQPITVPAGMSLWTDDFNNLFQVLK